MTTSVRIPEALLRALAKRAKSLRTSRTELIVKAIERDLGIERGWPLGFFESLANIDDDAREKLDETMAVARAARSSKKPVDL